MNPYRAKIVKEKDSLMAAKKTMWEGIHGQPMPKMRLKLHAPDNYSTNSEVYEKRVKFVKRLPESERNELVETRQLAKRLGFDNDDSLSKNRKQHAILVGAGKLPFAMKESLDIVRGIYETGKVVEGIKSRDGPIVNMLHIAGIIEAKTVKSGHKRIEIKDKKRLKRSMDENRIVWE